MLHPPETAWFGFYKEGTIKEQQVLENTQLYKDDWIGLRTLAESDRLFKHKHTCAHGDHTTPCAVKAFADIALPFFNNTINGSE